MAFNLKPLGATVVGILVLLQQPALAASSLLATIAEVFTFPAVVPLPIFDSIKPKIVPGSPVVGLSDRSEFGVAVIDAGRIRTCKISDPILPLKKSTQGFAKRFVGVDNTGELRLLFGFTEPEVKGLDTYEVVLKNAVSFTAPYNDVERNFASGLEDRSCAGAQTAPPRMVVRAIVADLELEFRGRQPLLPGMADKLRADGAQDLAYADDRTGLKAVLAGRLVALNLK
jgi:hypothetical protein